MIENYPQSAPRLIPLVRWNEYHDFPSVGTLRHFAFFRKTNGFDSVIRYVGKRVYLDEQAYFSWVLKQSEKEAGGST